MNSTAKLEISIFCAAIGLGGLGDALLRSAWGWNFALWGCALTAIIAILGRYRRGTLENGGQWLLVTMAFCCLSFLWRDSFALVAISFLGLATCWSLLILRAQGGELWASTMAKYLQSAVIAGLNSVFGIFPLLFGAREWQKALNGGSRRIGAVARGVLFSLPPLLLFGMLFAGADGVFKALLGRLFDFDLSHILLIGFIAFLIGGYLRGLLFGEEQKMADRARLSPARLKAIEIGTILGLLDLLFLAFVVIQIRYFFGGSALVRATTGLTYSQYARSGFWQLLTVAIILLPFLLLMHWFVADDDATAQRTFRWLAGTQIALLFVILASAFQRMHLYVMEYGLSEERFYPTAFMGWLAVVFVWFSLTVLQGRRQHFAFGAMVAGFLLIAALHIMNPDALIARTNLQRGNSHQRFDSTYLWGLSADAAPTIVAGWPALSHADQCTLKLSLTRWNTPEARRDWRSWTISRGLARKAVSSHPEIESLVCSEAKN